MSKIKYIYTDGGYNNKIGVYGFIILDEDHETILYEEFDYITDVKALDEIWNVAAEIEAASKAIIYVDNIEEDCKYDMYSDYQGIQGWATTWKAKNIYTQKYSALAKQTKKINNYIFVRGHSKNKWNEYVDEKLNNLIKHKETV